MRDLDTVCLEECSGEVDSITLNGLVVPIGAIGSLGSFLGDQTFSLQCHVNQKDQCPGPHVVGVRGWTRMGYDNCPGEMEWCLAGSAKFFRRRRRRPRPGSGAAARPDGADDPQPHQPLRRQAPRPSTRRPPPSRRTRRPPPRNASEHKGKQVKRADDARAYPHIIAEAISCCGWRRWRWRRRRCSS